MENETRWGDSSVSGPSHFTTGSRTPDTMDGLSRQAGRLSRENGSCSCQESGFYWPFVPLVTQSLYRTVILSQLTVRYIEGRKLNLKERFIVVTY